MNMNEVLMMEGIYYTLLYLQGSFSTLSTNSVVCGAFTLHNPDPAPFELYCYFLGIT